MSTVATSTNSWLDRSDRLISWFKWPAAVTATVLTLPIGWALFKVIYYAITAPTSSLLPFAAGLIGFTFLWRKWLGNSRWGIFLIKLEHESTHALFAILTGHSIIGFRAAMGEGSEVRFAGKGNWLITSAPYFFPTATIILFMLAFFLPFAALPWQSFLLGVALSYHVVSTVRETHRNQSDLQDLGTLFCWMFLPAANLAVIGMLIAFAHSGTSGLSTWLELLLQPWNYLRNLF